MWATSIPASVAAAEWKALKPKVGRVIFLMNLWSCSTVSFRYFTRKILIGIVNLTMPKFHLKRGVSKFGNPHFIGKIGYISYLHFHAGSVAKLYGSRAKICDRTVSIAASL